MVWDDRLIVVRIHDSGLVHAAVAEDLSFGENLCVAVGEGHGTIINHTVVEVLIPSHAGLITIQLVAECATLDIIEWHGGELRTVYTVAVGKGCIGMTNQVHVFKVAAYNLAAAPAVGHFYAVATSPSNKGCTLSTSLDDTRAKAVLDYQSCLTATVTTEDTCCLLTACIYIAFIAQVAKNHLA